MTIEEAKEIFLNHGYIQVKGGRIYDGDKWRESVFVISKWLEQQPCEELYRLIIDSNSVMLLENYKTGERTVVEKRLEPCEDIKEIEEVIKCDADAETKCKMISNILTAKPHYFKNQKPCDCISRSELLKAVDTWDKFGCDADSKLVPYKDCYVPYIHYDDVVKAIKGMSSVHPKPKTGHWEQYGYSWEDKFKCSECGKEQPKILCGERIIGHWSDYCPNRGADMRESEG